MYDLPLLLPNKVLTMTDREFDAFLSYNSQDRDVVLRIANQLRAQGLRLWLDLDQLSPGASWANEVRHAIANCHAALIMVGASGSGRFQEIELRSIMQEFLEKRRPIIPVFLPGTPSDVQLPLFLRSFTYVDLRLGVT